MDETQDMLQRLQAKVLVDETETVLKATAMAEDFEMQMSQVSHIAGMGPEQAKELEQRALALASTARTQSRLIAIGDWLLCLPGLRHLAR
jgi:hypothetical protein